jgi:signal transduction histidine kinase
LDNLLDNAVSYSPPRSTVDVSIKSLGKDVVEVTVEDEGEGVPIEDRARVFEPFYRSATLASRHAYGHGLGLSIAQSMVKQMGGEIWVDTRREHGSDFHFTLRRYE